MQLQERLRRCLPWLVPGYHTAACMPPERLRMLTLTLCLTRSALHEQMHPCLMRLQDVSRLYALYRIPPIHAGSSYYSECLVSAGACVKQERSMGCMLGADCASHQGLVGHLMFLRKIVVTLQTSILACSLSMQRVPYPSMTLCNRAAAGSRSKGHSDRLNNRG